MYRYINIDRGIHIDRGVLDIYRYMYRYIYIDRGIHTDRGAHDLLRVERWGAGVEYHFQKI